MQLGRGRKQILDDFDKRLLCLLDKVSDPKLQSDIVDLRIILADEIKPAMMRAEQQEPTAETRLRVIQEELRQIRAMVEAREPLLSMIEQREMQGQGY